MGLMLSSERKLVVKWLVTSLPLNRLSSFRARNVSCSFLQYEATLTSTYVFTRGTTAVIRNELNSSYVGLFPFRKIVWILDINLKEFPLKLGIYWRNGKNLRALLCQKRGYQIVLKNVTFECSGCRIPVEERVKNSPPAAVHKKQG